jgi:NADP-dependent 3-hydroxy acid dehydrogenase YdfG
MHCNRAVAPLMMEQHSGRIVNLSSIAAFQARFTQKVAVVSELSFRRGERS